MSTFLETRYWRPTLINIVLMVALYYSDASLVDSNAQRVWPGPAERFGNICPFAEAKCQRMAGSADSEVCVGCKRRFPVGIGHNVP